MDPGIQFAGSWTYQFSNGTDNWDLIITFNKDGTFSYVVAQNGNNNAFYSGNYRIAEGEDMVIAVISVETEMEIPLPHVDDFKFAVKKDATLTANLIVVSGQSLVFTLCEEITKVS